MKPNGTYPKPPNGWTCFHCGETLTTIGAAQDHFGETPIETPACVLKIQVAGERGLIMALRKAQRRADRLACHVEQLEYITRTNAATWSNIVGIKSAHDAAAEIDFLEGRALVAEAVLADIVERSPAMVEASRRRICQKPLEGVADDRARRRRFLAGGE